MPKVTFLLLWDSKIQKDLKTGFSLRKIHYFSIIDLSFT